MRIPSGVTDQYIYFVAVDATDFTTRETGLTTFTVYRSRNGGAAAAMTTPTINETDATNMPGVYELLLDEDMTIDAGDDSQEMAFHITHAGMAPVTRTIELYRPKLTAGETLTVASGVADADATVFSGTAATSVTNIENGIISGAAATGTLSTTQATSNLTGYADDQLIGRVIVWLSGACEGEASDITDYANTGGLLTFTALTTAPGNGDTFKIV